MHQSLQTAFALNLFFKWSCLLKINWPCWFGISLLKIVLSSLDDSEGSGGSPARAQDEGWHLHPHGGHWDIARMEHAVQVSVISLGIFWDIAEH
jgi:hypothetical protein